MAYTPNAEWASDTVITAAKLDNLETQYDEADTYFLAHNHDDLYQTQAEMQAAYWYAGNDGPGSGADADLLYKASGNLHGSAFSGLGIATGLIVLWYGSTASIPAGWHLCDGSAGTVNLVDRFVYGAGGSTNPGTTGGAATFTVTGTITVDAHSLTTAEIPGHVHPFVDSTPVSSGYLTYSGSSVGVSTTRSGTTATAGSGSGHGHSSGEGTALTGNAVACMPYYHALAFIQKTA